MSVSVPSQCHATRIFVRKGERVRQVLIPAEIAKTPFASCGNAQVSASVLGSEGSLWVSSALQRRLYDDADDGPKS